MYKTKPHKDCEMPVETAVGQPGFLHELGDGEAVDDPLEVSLTRSSVLEG
jgi:hypothetical protein